jgi:hypothetical protein
MEASYGLFVLSIACFVCAARETPIPLAAGGPRRKQPAQGAGGSTGRKTGDGAGQLAVPAFTERWRYSSDTLEAGPLAGISAAAMPGTAKPPRHLGFARLGLCVACERLPPHASSSRIGAMFVGFLSEEPVSALVSTVPSMSAAPTMTSTRWMPPPATSDGPGPREAR